MSDDKYSKRLESLFSDMEPVEAEPAPTTPSATSEMEALLARVAALEAAIAAARAPAAEERNQPATAPENSPAHAVEPVAAAEPPAPTGEQPQGTSDKRADRIGVGEAPVAVEDPPRAAEGALEGGSSAGPAAQAGALPSVAGRKPRSAAARPRSRVESPFAALVGKLKYPQKFVLISLLFVLPLTAFYPIVSQQITRIDQYGYKELYGILYLRPVRHLLEDIHAHELAVLEYRDGDLPFAEIEAIESQIDADFQALQTVHQQYRAELQLGTEPDDLSAQWQSLKTDAITLPEADRHERRDQFMADIQALISRVGDTSFLILDPDLDTYYMMDAVLLKLPESETLLAETLILGGEIIPRKTLTADERTQLIILTGRLKANFQAMNANVEVALRNNVAGNMVPLVEAPLPTAFAATQQFLEMVDTQLINAQTIAVEPQDFLAAAKNALAANFKFYDAASQALEIGVRGRINGFTQQLIFAAAFAVAGTIVAFVVGLMLMVAISRPLSELTMAAKRLAAGDLAARVIVTSADEAGQLGSAFNDMAQELRASHTSLEARTRDLALAAEVGHSLSQVRDLDRLLAEAVELIRSRFDLYYTQVYLTDAKGSALILRAGTGWAGAELLRRGHRLPIGPGSTNGRAAAEKRAVIVADTAASSTFRPNPLLPDTRSEMAVPLIIGEWVLGVLDMQSTRPGVLTDETLSAFEALAGQLAIALQNANLFAETEQARAEVEAQAGRLTREDWENFLNAVERSERLGYAYDQTAPQPLMQPLTEPLPATPGDHILAAPIRVAGETVGQLQLEGDEGRHWTNDEAELVQSVGRQVAQQVENLRFLAEADQARAEAERAIRRLTHEGWETYVNAQVAPAAGYAYDLNEVTPLPAGAENTDGAAHAQPLVVRGETVGELAVAAEDLDPEQAELVAAVADQLSAHIENLRLSEQTERALAETEDHARHLARLNELGEEISWANTTDGIMQAVTAKTGEIVHSDRISIILLTATGDYFQTISLSGEANLSFSETRYPLAGTTAEIAVKERRVVVITDPDLNTLPEMRRFTEQGLRSFMNVPLISGGSVIGTLNAASKQPDAYTARDENALSQIASLLAAALDSRRLFEQTQKRAAELETVAQVSTAASTVLEAQTLLQNVVDLTHDSFGLYHAHIYLLDTDGQTLSLAAGAGEVGRRMVAAGRSLSLNREQSLVARAARTRQAVIVNDVRAEPGFLPHPLLPDTRSEMAVPMLVGDRVLGVFDVQHDQLNYFTDEDVRIQTTLAAQVAVALQNANLFGEQAATVVRLRELDQLKSTFLANMSHELRTPLNSIIGFTDVMLEGLDGPVTTQMDNDLKVIQKNGRHLLELINDVLDMAKIEAGKMNLTLERFDLNEVLEEVLQLISPLAREKALDLRIESGNDLPLEADRVRLRQVVINLVGNAIKFTDTGGISLRAAQTNGHIRLAIRDTGLGITPDKLDTIFEAFNQADTSTTRKAGGTGLGLPISRRLIELHSGRLWAESTGVPGEGSTFLIELPAGALR